MSPTASLVGHTPTSQANTRIKPPLRNTNTTPSPSHTISNSSSNSNPHSMHTFHYNFQSPTAHSTPHAFSSMSETLRSQSTSPSMMLARGSADEEMEELVVGVEEVDKGS